MAKIEATLTRLIGDAVFAENTAHMSPPWLQIAGTEGRLAQ